MTVCNARFTRYLTGTVCVYNPKVETIISCAKFTSAVTRAAERGTTLELQTNFAKLYNHEEGPY